jgi:hypothetical protein
MDSNVDDADDEIVGDEGTASYGEVEDKDSDESEVERSPQHAPTGALVVPSATLIKLQFWRHEQWLLRQGMTV